MLKINFRVNRLGSVQMQCLKKTETSNDFFLNPKLKHEYNLNWRQYLSFTVHEKLNRVIKGLHYRLRLYIRSWIQRKKPSKDDDNEDEHEQQFSVIVTTHFEN